MEYNKKIMEHFHHPKNVGALKNADGIGFVGDPECGDFLKVRIKVKNDHIHDISFQCKGCPAAIASSSIMTQLAKGKHLDEAALITDEVIEQALGGLPEAKRHCSNLGATALYKAIINYIFGGPKS